LDRADCRNLQPSWTGWPVSLRPDDLAGCNVLVTAGPTREAIDPVRFISNPSSGKMGYAIARAAEYRGARVTLVHRSRGLDPPQNVELVPVVTVDDMASAVFARFEQAHVVVKVAAVSDYRPVNTETHKIKKSQHDMQLALERTTDILKTIGQRKRKDQIVVGFAAETRDMDIHARTKLEEKHLDMIAANLIGPAGLRVCLRHQPHDPVFCRWPKKRFWM
jgi:phosphopantothenoylcysteine decarboxylase/phosphopantothenate--cysteine ligase